VIGSIVSHISRYRVNYVIVFSPLDRIMLFIAAFGIISTVSHIDRTFYVSVGRFGITSICLLFFLSKRRCFERHADA